MSASSALDSIGASTLTPIVRRSLRSDSCQVEAWQVTQLGGGAGNPVSAGLFHFAGTARDGVAQLAWSVVLKAIQSPANLGWTDMGEGEDPTHWNYWKRELLVYRSGLFDTLPEGMSTPICYGAVELPGSVIWLWLEDISDSYEGVWPLDRYALAARHLGQMNGLYLAARPLPAFPWLDRERARQWVTLTTAWRTIPWDHPRVLAHYPPPALNPFRRMLLDHERFLTRLDLVPKSLNHGDTYPTNFKSRRLSDEREQTVALDWALVGVEPLGDDLGQLVLGAQMNLPQVSRADVDQALFESYVDGLRDSGCHADPRWVRFGYTASAALRVGLFRLFLLAQELEQSEAAAGPAVEPSVVPDPFEAVMASEAYELLEALS